MSRYFAYNTSSDNTVDYQQPDSSNICTGTAPYAYGYPTTSGRPPVIPVRPQVNNNNNKAPPDLRKKRKFFCPLLMSDVNYTRG